MKDPKPKKKYNTNSRVGNQYDKPKPKKKKYKIGSDGSEDFYLD